MRPGGAHRFRCEAGLAESRENEMVVSGRPRRTVRAPAWDFQAGLVRLVQESWNMFPDCYAERFSYTGTGGAFTTQVESLTFTVDGRNRRIGSSCSNRNSP